MQNTTLFTCAALLASSSTLPAAVIVTPTTDASALAAALGGGGGLTITSAAITSGNAQQFGTYRGFTGPPVTIGDGVVLSTGKVTQLTPEFNNGLQRQSTTPSTMFNGASTAEFRAYAAARLESFFNPPQDVAALLVNFTLSTPGQIAFDFIFGSVEYPQYTSSYTDAFFAFLDGTGATNQITFDAAGNPVQVGKTFSSALTTADTKTAFGFPHGLLALRTVSPLLANGSHSLLFEIGDVNDGVLDSAVFLSNLRVVDGTPGTRPIGDPLGGPMGETTIPEPATLVLMSIALALVAVHSRLREKSAR